MFSHHKKSNAVQGENKDQEKHLSKSHPDKNIRHHQCKRRRNPSQLPWTSRWRINHHRPQFMGRCVDWWKAYRSNGRIETHSFKTRKTRVAIGEPLCQAIQERVHHQLRRKNGTWDSPTVQTSNNRIPDQIAPNCGISQAQHWLNAKDQYKISISNPKQKTHFKSSVMMLQWSSQHPLLSRKYLPA